MGKENRVARNRREELGRHIALIAVLLSWVLRLSVWRQAGLVLLVFALVIPDREVFGHALIVILQLGQQPFIAQIQRVGFLPVSVSYFVQASDDIFVANGSTLTDIDPSAYDASPKGPFLHCVR